MNGSNGHSTGALTLEEQHQTDISLLRMHLQSKRLSYEGATQTRVPEQDDEVTVPTSNVSKTNKKQSWIRTLFLDLPLIVIFTLLLSIYCVDIIYHEYYVPMLEASARTASDKNLRKEYTYYDRQCTLQDLSSRTGEGLLLTNETTPKEAVDTMMVHGNAIIPQILDFQTSKKLRNYIMGRNAELTKAEKIPLSQGRHRVSFGIDATEDPIVSEALKQVANHALFQGLIEGLVGEDPAITEITAITAAAGALAQIWHQDVKSDGSGIKFARTFSHSYSLFITLQDTTGDMGATTVCPGTHYCTNDIYNICDKNGFQLNEADPDGVWQAGDGALFNQQVWHRGAKHNDRRAPERVVFIVSFIGRPDATRQLARGTYFHQKWISWGHTMQDLKDAPQSMAKPFSILRALSLWKPKSRNWGYDLITAATLRIANGQMGMMPHEVPDFQRNVIEKLFHIPLFLQGPVIEDDDAWTKYLEGTIRKVKQFFVSVNCAFIAFYLFIVFILCIKDRSTHPVKTASRRLLFTHGIPVLLAWRLMHRVSNSNWGHKTGDFLRPPFPDHLRRLRDDTISAGPTTLPTVADILLGTRYDAMYLGAYDRWLDYHPGNFDFRAQVHHCSRMPVSLDQKCIDSILTTKLGHFLEQDWRNGEWRIMTPVESRRHVQVALQKARNTVLARTAKSIAILVAYNRFDASPTRLSFDSVDRLQSLRDKLLSDDATSSVLTKPANRTVISVKSALPRLPVATAMWDIRTRAFDHTHWMTTPPKQCPYQIGDIIWVNYKGLGEYFKGTVMGVSETDGALDMAYVDGERQSEVPVHRAVSEFPKQGPYQVGDIIWVDYDGSGNFFKGAVMGVSETDGTLDMAYVDGERQSGVPVYLASPDAPLVENDFVMYTKTKKQYMVQVKKVKPNGWIDIEHSPGGRIQEDVRPKNFRRLDVNY